MAQARVSPRSRLPRFVPPPRYPWPVTIALKRPIATALILYGLWLAVWAIRAWLSLSDARVDRFLAS